jgi:hypothetical protein
LRTPNPIEEKVDMAENGDHKSESAVRTIVVSVLIALAAGGSAPWWWGKLFPSPAPAHQDNSPPQPHHQTPPANGVGACASGGSPNDEFHDAPAPNGSWDWNCNGQIESEWGTCESLTRAQCDPNTNETGAPPGFCTELRTTGGCPPKLGECGQPGWIYPCFYNPADGRCHAGGYETAKIMRCR